MMVGMIAFWLLIPAGIVWLLLGRPQRQIGNARDSALRILEERVARGEIDGEPRGASRGARPAGGAPSLASRITTRNSGT